MNSVFNADLESMVDAHYERIYRHAFILCGNEQDACDLAQETFLEALKGFSQFRRQSSPSTWLIGILRRRYLLKLRKKTPESLDENGPAQPAAFQDSPDEEHDIHAALTALSEPCRTAMVLFYFENMDYAAIASVLECPVGTVRSRLNAGRERMRKWLVQSEKKS